MLRSIWPNQLNIRRRITTSRSNLILDIILYFPRLLMHFSTWNYHYLAWDMSSNIAIISCKLHRAFFVKQESIILCFDDATVHSTSLNQHTTHCTQTLQLHAPFSLKLNANWINVFSVLQHIQSTILTNSDTNTLKKMFQRVFPSYTFVYGKWTLDSHGISIPTSKLWKVDQDIYYPEILLESRPRTGCCPSSPITTTWQSSLDYWTKMIRMMLKTISTWT